MSRTWNSHRWRVITAYLNATPSRSTPPLFLRTLAPGAVLPPPAAAGDSPAREFLPALLFRCHSHALLCFPAACVSTHATGQVAHPVPGRSAPGWLLPLGDRRLSAPLRL